MTPGKALFPYYSSALTHRQEYAYASSTSASQQAFSSASFNAGRADKSRSAKVRRVGVIATTVAFSCSKVLVCGSWPANDRQAAHASPVQRENFREGVADQNGMSRAIARIAYIIIHSRPVPPLIGDTRKGISCALSAIFGVI